MLIGIDLGGMSAKAACLEGGKLTQRVRVKLSPSMSAEEVACALSLLAKEAIEKAGRKLEDAEAIGIGSPGVIDGARGVVVSWSNYGWKNVPLADLLTARTGRRTFVANDANAAALGEAKYGAGQKYDDCALVTVGTGIGSGIVLGGTLFEGYRGAGTEFGHTVIRMGGRRCSCGRRGCLERYASASALIADTKRAMKRDPASLLWECAGQLGAVDGKTVFSAMERGDKTASDVFAKYIAALGDGIADLVNLLRPQAVILGGGISAEGERLLAPLREYVLPRLYVSAEYAPLALVAATLGNDAGLYGAAEYARLHLGASE